MATAVVDARIMSGTAYCISQDSLSLDTCGNMIECIRVGVAVPLGAEGAVRRAAELHGEDAGAGRVELLDHGQDAVRHEPVAVGVVAQRRQRAARVGALRVEGVREPEHLRHRLLLQVHRELHAVRRVELPALPVGVVDQVEDQGRVGLVGHSGVVLPAKGGVGAHSEILVLLNRVVGALYFLSHC